MRLPGLSHLQIAVLSALLAGERKGREIRSRLAQAGVRHSSPAFYQMMARLEDGSLVEGWYSQKVLAGQIIKERHYRITPAGKKAWREARDFYRQLMGAVGGGGGPCLTMDAACTRPRKPDVRVFQPSEAGGGNRTRDRPTRSRLRGRPARAWVSSKSLSAILPGTP